MTAFSEVPNDPLVKQLRLDAAHAFDKAVRTSQGFMGMIPAGTKEQQDAQWRAAVHAQAVYTLALWSRAQEEKAPDEPIS